MNAVSCTVESQCTLQEEDGSGRAKQDGLSEEHEELEKAGRLMWSCKRAVRLCKELWLVGVKKRKH